MCVAPFAPVPLNNAFAPAEKPVYVEDAEAVLIFQPAVALELVQPVGSDVVVPKLVENKVTCPQAFIPSRKSNKKVMFFLKDL